MSEHEYDSSLILAGPGDEAASSMDSLLARLPEVVWLRNPNTGVIYKVLKTSATLDTIRHALQGEPGVEGGRKPYTLSSEAAARAQAVELAQLQGRPLPVWAYPEQAAEASSHEEHKHEKTR